jgi:hypothetical protein
MIGAAIQPPNISERDNLLKSPEPALDCRVRPYDIVYEAR